MNWFCVFFKHSSNRSSQMSLMEKNCNEDNKRDENSEARHHQEKVVVVEKIGRSSVEWVFGLVAMLLLCTCAVLAAELALMVSKLKSEKNYYENATKFASSFSTCVSVDCLREAAFILENTDFSKDPCSDFYQYACGGYGRQKDAKKDHFQILIERAKVKLEDIISSDINPNEPRTITKIKTFFHSCINTEQIESRGLTPARNILHQVGGWPVVSKSKWKTSLQNWEELANLYRKVNVSVNFFFEPRIAFDVEKNGLKTTLGLSAANLGLSSITDESKHEEYYQKLIDLAVLFGADRQNASQEMRYVFYFENVVKHTYWESFDLNSQRIVKMSIAQLQKLIPQVNWRNYISSFLPFPVNYNDSILVDTPQFLPKFAHLLYETDIRILANYAAVRAIWNMANLLNADVQKIIDVKIKKPNKQNCFDIILKYFSLPIGGYYLNKHVDYDIKSKTENIINSVKEAFLLIFDQTSWSYVKKQILKHSVLDMNTFIGYPQEMTDYNKIDSLYEDLLFKSDEYFENYRKLKKHYFDKSVEYSRNGNNANNSWIQNGVAVIAFDVFYLHLTNTIYLPAIMIEEVFRIAKRPNYMNFASFGSLFAREVLKVIKEFPEISNGFGNATNSCLAKQHKSKNGLNLDILDDISNHYLGIYVAYIAYQLWTEKYFPERALPGKDFNVEKLFWLTYANGFCAKLNPSVMSSDLSYLRVNLALKNVQEFSNSFNCPLQTSMNPKIKCRPW